MWKWLIKRIAWSLVYLSGFLELLSLYFRLLFRVRLYYSKRYGQWPVTSDRNVAFPSSPVSSTVKASREFILTVHSAVGGLEVGPPSRRSSAIDPALPGKYQIGSPGWQEKTRIAGNDHGWPMVQYRVFESNPRNSFEHSAYSCDDVMWCLGVLETT